MPDDPSSSRLSELVEAVVAPLILGGPVRPVRPFGVEAALALRRDGAGLRDAELASRISVARVRRARLCAAVDALPEIDGPSFSLAAALNDLLQLTNHTLGGAFTRGRYGRLLRSVEALCERIPPPRDVGEALARHATFARVLELTRSDSTVRWWTGSARFRGEPPSRRLLVWPELRRVDLETRTIDLVNMVLGIDGVAPAEFAQALGLWLTRSPLTDLANVARRMPPFAWSASTLALVAVPPGRTLAFRAAAREPAEAAVRALREAAARVPAGLDRARALADDFASDLAAAARASAPSDPPEERPPGGS